MKMLGAALIATLVVVGSLASEPAEANGGRSFRGGGHHGHGHFRHFHHGPRVGVFIGAPVVAAPLWYYSRPYYYGPGYYPPAYYPYYASPPAAIEYVEQSQAAPAQPAQQNWWYYCEPAGAYYPYVKECAAAWQRVAPQPPQSQ